ncbi:DUF4397 domain-containing protein [Mucilaginibacter phyllosphaerae]|uniref:DUF4397 domain-containing protein n=1 Tax=Mucilaginibacter phyllosphaerae TaxID=1812349 RepID=A0A4Y8AA01_9SPHI|nr:DUF4397 domain-containing protein [Mucilaginibacter phyllosphaerae]MBB3970703.1 hypothetical protein [Mucilaginibacter phyllosphaerae]TEW64704.1 DUF4397 domain-containing protein [Mucilaginibacter phyllosphaerae]GGH20381.1 hypothetical protein GCM10007352_32350 [Mucilaginibacter phyllosphaerae]
MPKNNKSSLLLGLCLLITGVMVVPMLASCGKSGVNATNANARLMMVNVSPDIQPYNLYARYIKQGTNSYSYPNAYAYFLVNTTDLPLQIRTAQTINGVNPTNLLTLPDTLKPNTPYTWFVTGLRADGSLASILTVDTGSMPAIGRGKVRFVNVSPANLKLNLALNDTLAFKSVAYKSITSFVEVTAGSYNFNIAETGAPNTVLAPITNFNVLDGKLYTVYFYGLSNTSDTAKYGANILLNSLPAGTKY